MSISPEGLDDSTVVMRQVEALLELPDEEFSAAAQQFTDQRLVQLEGAASSPDMLTGLDGRFTGFITPQTEIKPRVFGPGFMMNDASMYPRVLDHFKDYYSMFANPERSQKWAFINTALVAVQYAQQGYFGGVRFGELEFAKRAAMLERGMVVGGDDYEPHAVDSSPATIADFKGIAMCAERAAAANNMLWILGLQPDLNLGELKIAEEPSDPHAYLTMKDTKGNTFIYDPTNPILIYDKDDNLISTNPATYKVGDEFLSNPGSYVMVDHRTYTKTEAGDLQPTTEKYVFRNSPHNSES